MISLKKGNSVNLSKVEPGLKKFMIGLGWEMISQKLDLDASVFILGANGKLLAEEYFIFYNNLNSPDGAIKHTGDNRTGLGDDDDEMILANLDLVNPGVKEMVIVISIHEAEERRHHFGMLSEAYVRFYDVEKQREVLRYDLDAEFGGSTEVVICKLEKQNQDWIMTAVGQGQNTGLQSLVDKYI